MNNAKTNIKTTGIYKLVQSRIRKYFDFIQSNKKAFETSRAFQLDYYYPLLHFNESSIRELSFKKPPKENK